MLVTSLKLSIISVVTALFGAIPSLAANSACESVFAVSNSPHETFNIMAISLDKNLEGIGLKAVVANKQASWKRFKFSDPNQHDSNYVYIVHSLNTTEVTATKRIFGSNNQRVNLIENPERISDIPIISASLVSQDKPMTYGMGIGLILKVPAKGIFSTREVDLQSNQVRDFLEKSPELAAKKIVQKYQEYGLDSPQELLLKTPSDFYNEILLLGKTPEGEKVEVVGYFVKAIDGMNIVELMGNMDALKIIAAKNSLPVVILNSTNLNINRLNQYEEWQ